MTELAPPTPRGLSPWLRRHPRSVAVATIVLSVAGAWSIKLVRLSQSVDAYRTYWAQPRGEPGGLVYVALGDSAAQGIGASRPEQGYVGLLAQRMGELTRQPVQVINLSVSGAKIGDVLDTQLPQLRQLKPDVVTVAIGGNDVRSYDRVRFSADVDKLTAALPAGALIADVPYFMHGRWEKDSAEAARTVAASAGAQQLRIVPLNAAQRDRGFRAMLTDFAPDWFHPSDLGHRVWADAVWKVMSEVPALKAVRDPA